MKKQNFIWALLMGTITFSSCERDPNNPGTEFAPQMYVSKAYEPYTQVEKNKINPMGLNMREPAKGTIARRFANNVTGYSEYSGDLMYYNIPKDSMEMAERLLTPPFEPTDAIVEEGKVLYTRYCSPCHGEKGDGKGKVADMYKGVANISASGALKNVNSGHIFHTITHGKGRMWSHASQLNPDERWKVVYYVHTLQGQELKNKPIEFKAEKGKTFTLKNVLFKTGSNDLEESSRKELDALIKFLKENPDVKGEISGHTDNEGDAKKNLELSDKRANAVDMYLQKAGIAQERVVAKGYGDAMPKVANDTKENKAQNRRIEFKIL